MNEDLNKWMSRKSTDGPMVRIRAFSEKERHEHSGSHSLHSNHQHLSCQRWTSPGLHQEHSSGSGEAAVLFPSEPNRPYLNRPDETQPAAKRFPFAKDDSLSEPSAAAASVHEASGDRWPPRRQQLPVMTGLMIVAGAVMVGLFMGWTVMTLLSPIATG